MTAPWTSSESTAAIIPAFVTALQTVEDVKRNKQADIKTNAGQMKYNYADLDAVLEAAKPVLLALGLAVTQPASTEGVHTILLHTSGEWIAFPPLKIQTAQSTPQAQGSAISYARRYAMCAALGIATEDDDGKAASAEPKQPRSPRATPAPKAAAPKEGGPSRKQLNMLMAIYGRLGITERAEQKVLAAGVLGVPVVVSHNDLSVGQVSELIDVLVAVQAGERQLVLNGDGVAVAVAAEAA